MASNSLLESYIDVVNENLKKLEKKFSENIFRLAENLFARKILIFRKFPENPTVFRLPDFTHLTSGDSYAKLSNTIRK